MNTEVAALAPRALASPKKSFSSYVVRVLVVALLLALIPATAAWTQPAPLHHYHFDFQSPQPTGVCFLITITAHDASHNGVQA